MNKYACFYNNKQIEIEAESLFDAKNKAVDKFSPPKSKRHMVSVVLTQVGDREVPLNNSNADFG